MPLASLSPSHTPPGSTPGRLCSGPGLNQAVLATSLSPGETTCSKASDLPWTPCVQSKANVHSARGRDHLSLRTTQRGGTFQLQWKNSSTQHPGFFAGVNTPGTRFNKRQPSAVWHQAGSMLPGEVPNLDISGGVTCRSRLCATLGTERPGLQGWLGSTTLHCTPSLSLGPLLDLSDL